MKVLVVNNMAPFVWGGAEELAVNLQKNLIAAGHQTEVLRIPFQWDTAMHIPSKMLMARAFELRNVDRVIALKFPAYLIRHPHKTLWILHQYRQAYDLYDTDQTNLSLDQMGSGLRHLIHKADDECFRESRRIFTNSEVTRKRLRQHNGFDAEVLLPPINNPELFGGASSRGYIFAGGRINGMKRQHLLLEALAQTPSNTRLLIAGPPDTPEDGQKLIELTERWGLGDRVKLDLRFLPRRVYADYVNGADAVAYLPFDEDSLGYVAMEAATAGKALITTHDSGGVLGLVKHRQTGWVAEPAPASLADAMSAVNTNSAITRQLGMAARELWLGMGITWPQTVEALLS